MINKALTLVILLSCFVFLPFEAIAIVQLTKSQAAFSNVRTAMSLFTKDNGGRIPANWNDLEPYLNMKGIEEWLGKAPNDAIKLLGDVRPEPRIDGRRVLAILLTPSEDGAYWAAIEEDDGQVGPAVFTAEQLRNIGFEVAASGLKGVSTRPLSPTASGEEVKAKTPLDWEPASPPDIRRIDSLGEARKAQRLNALLLALGALLLIGILFLLFRVYVRRSGVQSSRRKGSGK